MTEKEGPTVAELVEKNTKIVASFGVLADYWMGAHTKANLMIALDKLLPED